MKLKLQEAMDILQAEIVWCLDHPDKELNQDTQIGFMNGLRQAQHIIKAAENAVRKKPQDVIIARKENRTDVLE